MSPTIVYAIVLIVILSFFSACARTVTKPATSKRERVTCRSGPAAKRSSHWSPPRVRF